MQIASVYEVSHLLRCVLNVLRVLFSLMASIVLALGGKILPSSLYERLTTSSIAKRLARGSLWSLSGSASARILLLVAMIAVARVLGQVSFGELGLIQSTLGMAGLIAGVGLGGTATRFVAKYATLGKVRCSGQSERPR